MKSKIAIFYQTGTPLRIEEQEIPSLREGEILVKNEYSTLCRSDISTYTGKRIEKSPTILGHEIVGRIEAFGPGKPATDINGIPLHTGERITWAIYAANPDGEMARRGIPQKAPDLFKYGHEQLTPNNTLHGGLAEYTILRAYTPVLPLTEAVPLPAAAIINCSVATVAGSLRLAGEIRGHRVAIWGIGMLGTIACAMCKEKGAAEIIAIDVNEQRLAEAKPFGITRAFNPADPALRNLQADITIDYSGHLQAMAATLDTLAIGGTAVWVGGVCPQPRLPIDTETVIRRLLTIRGLHNYNREDFREAVAFMTAHHGDYPIASLVHDGFDLDHTEEAFRYAIEKNPYRVGIRFR